MNDASMTVRRTEPSELGYVEALLEANDLPYRDVRSKPESFFVAFVNGERVGVGGIELCGAAGLLRSVAIEKSRRGNGYGSELCGELEAYARTSQVTSLYLLTTTAEAFFRTRGYEAVDRTEAPSGIRQTTEFTDLCPNSAICMRKRL